LKKRNKLLYVEEINTSSEINEMIESIKIPVIVGDNEKELAFEYEEDVVSLKIDNKEICMMSYAGNFEDVIERMRGIW
jgi:hypothetical protein